jgi:acetoin utilization deacetylase AcuC-like enzyme
LAEIGTTHPSAAYRAFVEGAGDGPAFDEAVTAAGDMHVGVDGSTRRAALTAAALCIDAARAVVEARAGPTHAFCLVRPPGHHCGGVAPNGFCLINNVIVAVTQAVNHPQFCERVRETRARRGRETDDARPRVAIVDIDVHHGDGTQQLVDAWNADASQPAELLFVSMHRYDKGAFFPKTGHPAAVGVAGLTVNIGFDTERKQRPPQVMCDATFDAVGDALVHLFTDASTGFEPDMVFVSCGFDAAEGDQLGGMGAVNGFPRIVERLARLPSSIGTMVALEGGYDVEAVGQATVRVVTALVHAGRDVAGDPSAATAHALCFEALPALSWLQAARRDAAARTDGDEDVPQPQLATSTAVDPVGTSQQGMPAVDAILGELHQAHNEWALAMLQRTWGCLAGAGAPTRR